ncbi:MAG: nitrate reductase associated protein [Chitinophagaceae bacterium]
MKEMYPGVLQPSLISECRNEIIFFKFEEDFVKNNVRCIPMMVRFKLDACGIKLKLSEWSKMTIEERKILSVMDCSTRKNLLQYRHYLRQLVMNRTGIPATDLPVEADPAWANTDKLPLMLVEKLEEFAWHISLQRWQMLDNLQRFVLLKLCRPGHENENFPKAIKEFGLI